MSLVKSYGVVIKTQDYKENDKLVWLYTSEHGKVSTIARGAKRSRSKFLSITLQLCYGEYVYFKGKGLANLQ